jgi:hypothetical protein
MEAIRLLEKSDLKPSEMADPRALPRRVKVPHLPQRP